MDKTDLETQQTISLGGVLFWQDEYGEVLSDWLEVTLVLSAGLDFTDSGRGYLLHTAVHWDYAEFFRCCKMESIESWTSLKFG